MHLLACSLLLALLGCAAGAPFHVPGASAGEQLLLREGAKALAQFTERAEAETPGALQRLAGRRGCWTAATASLRADCGRLDDDGARRLALALANCQLEASGERTYPCAPGRAFRDCTKGMTDKAWTSYSAAQGQATAVCYYLAAETFQAEAKQTVERLQEASAAASGKLSELGAGLASSLEVQARVVESQGAVAEGLQAVKDSQAGLGQLQLDALDGQQRLLDGQTALAESAAAAASTLEAVAAATAAASDTLGRLFEAHAQAAQATLTRLHALGEGAAALEAAQARLGMSQGELLAAAAHVTDRQQALAGALDAIGTTLTSLAFWQERLARAMSLVLGASFTLDDIAWTAGALGAVSAATSLAPTAAARPALMLALAGSACAERAMVPWLITSTAAARATLAAGTAAAQRGGSSVGIVTRDALTAFASRLERAECKWLIRKASALLCAALLARAAWRHAGATARAARTQADMEQRLQRSLSDALQEHERRLFDALREEIAASPAFRRAMEPNAFLDDRDVPMPMPPRVAPPATMARLPPPYAAPAFEAAAVPASALYAAPTASRPASAMLMVTPSPCVPHAAPASRGSEPLEAPARARLDAVLEQAATAAQLQPDAATAMEEEGAMPPPSRGASHAEPVLHKRKRPQPAAVEAPAKRTARARSGQCSGA